MAGDSLTRPLWKMGTRVTWSNLETLSHRCGEGVSEAAHISFVMNKVECPAHTTVSRKAPPARLVGKISQHWFSDL